MTPADPFSPSHSIGAEAATPNGRFFEAWISHLARTARVALRMVGRELESGVKPGRDGYQRDGALARP